jgi:transcriptional regulator with XRE-family HTH domain
MTPRSDFLNQKSIGSVQVLRNARYRRLPYNLIVLDWYLNEWLETLQVSQAELGRRTDYPKAKVSDLANGKQRYNRDILNDIAHALNVQPFELLMHPADAMAQRRIRKLAEEMVQIPHGGTVVDLEDRETETRKAG